jgi:hypothetical protein
MRKFLGLSGNRKSANFYKILHRLCPKTVVFLNDFCVVYKIELEHYAIMVRRNLADLRFAEFISDCPPLDLAKLSVCRKGNARWVHISGRSEGGDLSLSNSDKI